MTRLTDADALIDCFEMRGDSDLGWHLYEVIDEINDAPTAYELDKVVEELKTAPYFHGECGHIETDEAIDIVKRGGINE